MARPCVNRLDAQSTVSGRVLSLPRIPEAAAPSGKASHEACSAASACCSAAVESDGRTSSDTGVCFAFHVIVGRTMREVSTPERQRIRIPESRYSDDEREQRPPRRRSRGMSKRRWLDFCHLNVSGRNHARRSRRAIAGRLLVLVLNAPGRPECSRLSGKGWLGPG